MSHKLRKIIVGSIWRYIKVVTLVLFRIAQVSKCRRFIDPNWNLLKLPLMCEITLGRRKTGRFGKSRHYLKNGIYVLGLD